MPSLERVRVQERRLARSAGSLRGWRRPHPSSFCMQVASGEMRFGEVWQSWRMTLA